MLNFHPSARNIIIGIILLLPLILLSGCQKEEKKRKDLVAVATTGMVADIVSHVAGKHVTVKTLMGPGVDPHLYKASPGDVQLLSKADAIFYNGLHLEGKMSDVFDNLSRRKPTLALASAIKEKHIIGSSSTGSLADPHVWMDVHLWSKTAIPIADFLSKIDPDHKKEYFENATEYKRKLIAVHNEIKGILSKLGSEHRSMRMLITSHDAFKYFGRAYGLQVMGIQGISTESEAGLKRINQLVQLIYDNSVETVFVETSVPQKNIQALIEGVDYYYQTKADQRRKKRSLKIGGELYSDSMGQQGELVGTYIGMMKHNAWTIYKGLKDTGIWYLEALERKKEEKAEQEQNKKKKKHGSKKKKRR